MGWICTARCLPIGWVKPLSIGPRGGSVGRGAETVHEAFYALSADCSAIACRIADETTAPVIDLGRGITKTGYLWALARDDRAWGGQNPLGVVYSYTPRRSGEHGEAFLTGLEGMPHKSMAIPITTA